MPRPLSPSWRWFAALLILVFLARGAALLSILPPLEGWDEYQHIAYIVYLAEQGRPPVLGESEVPRSLYSAIAAYPHAALAQEQVRGVGGVGYEGYWQRERPPEPSPGAGPIPLYQAQHAGLYYRLMVPIYRWIGLGRFVELVAVLRIVNVAFGALALAVCLFALEQLTADGVHRRLIGLLIALQPLFLVNCARVASDALAVLLGTAVVAILLTQSGRRPVWAGALGGAALGLGLLAKAVNLSLLPFAIFVYLWHIVRGRLAPGRGLIGLMVLVVLAAAISFKYFQFNLAHFGLLTPMQEAVDNARQGRTTSDWVAAAWSAEWWKELSRRYLRHSLWRGGWSYLASHPILTKGNQYTIIAAALGGLAALWSAVRRRRRVIVEPGAATGMLVCGLCFALGMGYHMLHSLMANKGVGTNIWYAMVSFPWLLCLLVQGAAYWPGRWTGVVIALNMAVVYLAIDVYGMMIQMVGTYAGAGWGSLARSRLDSLHPSWLNTAWTLPAWGCVAGLLTLALVMIFARRESKSP